MVTSADPPDLPERLAIAEAALRDSEARLAALLASVPVGVAMIDADGRIVTSNTEYLRFCPTGIMPSRDGTRVAQWRGWDEEGRSLQPADFPGARAQRGESVVPGQEMLYTDDEGDELWVRVATVPIRDAAGTVTGQASVISDIDALKRLSESRREGERNQALLLELSDAIRPLDDAAVIAQTAVDLLGAHLAIDRCTYVEFIEDGDRHHIVVEAEYRTGDTASFVGLHSPQQFGADLGTLQAGEIVVVADVEHEGGTARSLHEWRDLQIGSRLGVPVMKNGQLVVALTIQHREPRYWSPSDIRLVRDTAERTWVAVEHARARARLRRRDAALREAQARAQLLVDGIAVATWETPSDGKVTVDSPSWRRLTGQTYEEYRGFGWIQALHPDDRGPTMMQWQDARDHNRGFDLEYRLRLRNGAYLWVNARAIPLLDSAGRIEKWVGMNIDIHALREAQDRQDVMVAELQHRTRNLIAVIQSIADKMIDGAPSLEAFGAGFGERLSALSRVQKLLSYTTMGRRVTFEELLHAELLAHGAIGRRDGDAHLTLDGPSNVRLRSGAVQSLALAIHELATNAVKYGALRGARGRLRIAWHVAHDDDDVPWLHVDWRESGMDLPHPTTPSPPGGYGRQLIERALPYQLGALTEYTFTRDGVHCRIAVPVVSTRADKDDEDG